MKKVHPEDCGTKWEGVMRKKGEKSNQMFVPIILAWFDLVIRGNNSEHMGGSSCPTISLMPCGEGCG